MEKFLKPDRLDLDCKSTTAEEDYVHWKRTFRNFLDVVEKTNADADKLQVLLNYISPKVYHHIAEYVSYKEAI